MNKIRSTHPEGDRGGNNGGNYGQIDRNKAVDWFHKVSHPRWRSLFNQSAQGMVEFALVLPVLLMLIFGIIEFGRIFQAWLSVQNSARFAVRYAVTGQYNPDYCDDAAIAEAGNEVFSEYLGTPISPLIIPAAADTYGGDPQDCRIPNTYNAVLYASAPFSGMSGNELSLAVSETIENMTSILQDYARLQSIQDIAQQDAFAIALDTTKTNTDEIGYFKVVVLSSRVAQYCADQSIDWNDCITTSDPSLDKYWSASPAGFEDAGGPGDSILIGVDFNHPLITPFLVQAWPYLHLTTVRRGNIEIFRASKAINVAPPLGMPSPTASLTPSITPSPTPTETPTFTPSRTPTQTLTPSTTSSPTTTSTTTTTLTPSKTFTPSMTPSITQTPTKTRTPTLTPTPSCGNLSMSLGMNGSRIDRLQANIYNGNFMDADFGTVVVSWDSTSGNSNRYVDWINVNSTRVYGGNDYSSTTSATRSGNKIVNIASESTSYVYVDYNPDSRGISGTFVVNVTLQVGSLNCPLAASFTRVGPTPTNTRTATRTSPPTRTFTITQTPTTDAYTNDHEYAYEDIHAIQNIYAIANSNQDSNTDEN